MLQCDRLYLLSGCHFADAGGGGTVLTFSPRSGMPKIKNIKSIFSVGIPAALATLLFERSIAAGAEPPKAQEKNLA